MATASTSKLRHEFYQTDANVVVSVFVKNVKATDLTSDIQPRSLSLTIRLPTGSEAVFDVDPLAREVDVAASSVKALSSKIEVTLRKKVPGIKWNALEGDEEDAQGSAMNSAGERTGPSYPSSAKHKGNWDAISRQVDKEESEPRSEKDKDPNAGGDRELNKLFQKLYQGATDEQRMAMMKSYQESNGTALSTDWGDVGSKKVETKPPEGVIAREWGKEKPAETKDDGFMSWAKGASKKKP